MSMKKTGLLIFLIGLSSLLQNSYATEVYCVNHPCKILIEKSKYQLSVYDEIGWIKTYPVVFGSDDQSDKQYEGDKKTPEGIYKIVNTIFEPQRWDRFLALNYPTSQNIEKFNRIKSTLPKNATIGGGIGIHGTGTRPDVTIDLRFNWTNGCISMKNKDVEELYNIISKQSGTEVKIVK